MKYTIFFFKQGQQYNVLDETETAHVIKSRTRKWTKHKGSKETTLERAAF